MNRMQIYITVNPGGYIKSIVKRVLKRATVILALSSVLLMQGCKKFIEIDAPATSTNGQNVYETDPTAAAVITGIYIRMAQGTLPGGGVTSLSLFPSLSADELTLNSGINNNLYLYYINKLNSKLDIDYWKTFYPIIFVANSAIEGVENSSKLSPLVKQRLLGEAKFIRAFSYFYLVNLFGPVPLATTLDYKINANLGRSPVSDVYNLIISDLVEAKSLLSDGYLGADVLTASTQRVRPNKWVATALLSRAYLYKGDFANAEIQASLVIDNTSRFKLDSLSNVFKITSTEAIWQLQAITPTFNTLDAFLFILPANGPNLSSNPVYLSPSLVNAFEPNDNRKNIWVGSVTPSPGTITYYYPYKYKAGLNAPLTEFKTVLRLTEQYLIRAEARAQQNKISEAKSDLDIIRNRAWLSNSSANDKASLLAAIIQERKIEFFTEWGHRWLDLKRTGSVDAVMSSVTAQKGGTWQTTAQFYPLPFNDLLFGPNLTQNSGY